MHPPPPAAGSPAPFRCPSCGDAAPVPVLCDRCNRAMVPAEELPAIALDAIRPRRLDLTHAWLAAGTLLGIGVAAWPAVLAAILVMSAVAPSTGVFCLVVGAVVGVAMVFASAQLGRYAAQVRLREAQRRARVREARARIDALPRRRLADVAEGPVRVVGRIRNAAVVYSADGLPCAALEALAAGDAPRAPRQSTGGAFDLEDLGGATARVTAEPVIVAAGLEFAEHAHVPPGALVELVGTARRVAARGAGASAGRAYRSAGESLEIVGTHAHPVVLRVLAV